MLAEGVAKLNSHVRVKHEAKHQGLGKPIRFASAFISLAIVGGIAVAGWSVFEIQDRPPPQASKVILPSPSPMLTQEQTPVVASQAVYDSYPELGERVGTITLESLDLSWPIYQGTEEEQLSRGVGHYVGSVFPGMTDNTILSGHRSTVFGRLGELQLDDLVQIKTKAGIFTYQVRTFRVVDRSDQTVIMPTETAVLTLTTCYPFGSWAPSTEAYIVTADLVGSFIK